jgi:hypothetical protein
VLDPEQLFQTQASGRVSPGPALRFLALRFEKILHDMPIRLTQEHTTYSVEL